MLFVLSSSLFLLTMLFLFFTLALYSLLLEVLLKVLLRLWLMIVLSLIDLDSLSLCKLQSMKVLRAASLFGLIKCGLPWGVLASCTWWFSRPVVTLTAFRIINLPIYGKNGSIREGKKRD